MRPLIPAVALLLCACSPLAAPGVVGNAAPYARAAQSTAQPDYIATAAVAQAAAEVQAAQTATAERNAIATHTQVAGETQAAGTAMYAAAGATQTAAAVSVTLQALAAAQATGTYSAANANASATYVIPAMTATRAAQVVIAEREERNGWAWLIAGIVAFVGLVVSFGSAGVGYVNSLGAKANAEAYRISSQVVPPVIAKQDPAPGLPGYVIVMINGALVQQDIPALIAAIDSAQRPPAPPPLPAIINVTPKHYMTKKQAEMIAFVNDAQRAAGVTVATHIPSNDRMGWASTSAWQAHVDALKALKIAYTDGTGKPKTGEYRTKLADGWTLTRLLEELETGQLIIPTGE